MLGLRIINNLGKGDNVRRIQTYHTKAKDLFSGIGISG
jgi:hypothetical protein